MKGTVAEEIVVSQPLVERSTNEKMIVEGTIKAAATDIRYFARSNFCGSLIHKKRFGLI